MDEVELVNRNLQVRGAGGGRKVCQLIVNCAASQLWPDSSSSLTLIIILLSSQDSDSSDTETEHLLSPVRVRRPARMSLSSR